MNPLEKAQALVNEGICDDLGQAYIFLLDMGECDESDIPASHLP